MDGNNKSEDVIQKIEEKLLEFEKTNGFRAFTYTGEDLVDITDHLMVSLDGMTAEMCYEVAVKLDYYNLFLQKLTNQDSARVNFITSMIKEIVCPTLSNYTGSFEQKEYAAINDNDVAKYLEKKRRNLKMRLDRLSYLGPRIENFSKTLQNLARFREKHGGN